jgi:hypothetical protein
VFGKRVTACSAELGRSWQNAAILLVTVWALTINASESSQNSLAVAATSTQELAKEKHNPFADQITLPLQISSSLEVGPGNGTTAGLDFQPAIPFSLGQNWNIIARPDISILDSEPPNRKFGLGDIEFETYLTPALFHKWVWGFGPVVQVPSATAPELGTGKWSAGPAFGLIYLSGPWVNGILAHHLWSFAGQGDRAQVSQSTLEPEISYNSDSGWFLGFDSTMTADWSAERDKRWTVPIGLDVGKAFQVGKQSQSLSFQVGTYYNALRAEGVGRWLLRFQITLTLPKHSSSQSSNTADK